MEPSTVHSFVHTIFIHSWLHHCYGLQMSCVKVVFQLVSLSLQRSLPSPLSSYHSMSRLPSVVLSSADYHNALIHFSLCPYITTSFCFSHCSSELFPLCVLIFCSPSPFVVWELQLIFSTFLCRTKSVNFVVYCF